jgi:hypothetical protein
MLRKLTLSFLMFGMVAIATPSFAGVGIGADIGLTVPMGKSGDDGIGHALSFRLFKDWSFGIVAVGVEGMGNYHAVGSVSVSRGLVGIRATAGLGFKVYIASHVGYGSARNGLSGWSYDVGGGLSYKLGPVRAGLYARYNELKAASTLKWVDTGASLEIGF